MTKARELAELGKVVSVHDNRLDFDRAVVIPGLIDAAGTTTIADGSITTAKIADDAVTTAKVNPAQTDITSVGTLTSFRSTGIDDNADALAITINSSEQVGVGTASPDGTLHIHTNTAGSVTANVDFDDLVIENNTNMGMSFLSPNNTFQQIGFGDPDDNDIGKIVYQHTNDSMQFVVNAAERVRIDSSGRVGINQTSFATVDTMLSISELTGHLEVGLISKNDSGCVLNFGDPEDYNIGRVKYAHDDNSMRFDTNNAERVRIDSSGRVGIGTTSPGAKLTVSGLASLVNLGGNTTGSAAIYVNSTSGHTGELIQILENGTSRMHMANGGNLGIGNNNPSAFNSQARNLVVGSGSGANGITIYSGNDSAANIFFADGTSGDDPTRGGINYNHVNNSMNFRVNDAPKMYLLSDGKAGIGTSSPAFKLQVSGTNTQIGIESTTTNQNASLYYTANGAHQWEVGTNVSAGLNYEVYDRVSNTSRFVVTHTPTVGIGTNSPSTILHINSNAPHVRIVNTTNTSYSGGTSKISMDNAAVAAARGMISETLYTWSQTTADSWILVRTPQAYANNEAGGWAEFKLAWTGYHATNNTLMFWTAIFHNNHGRTFSWSKTAVTTIGGGSGSYSPYNYTPAVAFYRQTSAGGGYNSNDSWMRNLYIKVSGNAASSVATKRSLYIKGLSGGFDYEIAHAGTSTPAGGLTSV